MSGRIGHVGMYPPYIRTTKRQRTLAEFSGGRLITEDGEELPATTYEEFVDSILAHHLDVRVHSLTDWKYFEQALEDKRAKAGASKNRVDRSVRIVSFNYRVGRKWAKVYAADGWGANGDPAENLAAQREVCDYFDVGTYATAGALGQAVMQGYMTKRHTMPADNFAHVLYSHVVGGRDDTPGLGETFEGGFEYDRTQAYVAECLNGIPVGTAMRLPLGFDEQEAEYLLATWFVECVVYVPRKVDRLGPFPFRDSRGIVHYNYERGQYECWLWREEIEDCRTAGYKVICRHGFGWERCEPVLREWAQAMHRARESAPERLQRAIKLIALAAIGWHAMQPVRWTVRRFDEALDMNEDGRCIREMVFYSDGTVSDYVAIPEEVIHPSTMIHWASYIWMQARRTLFRRAIAEEAEGNRVTMTNFDSIRTLKRSSLPITTCRELGEWREQEVGPYRITAARSVEDLLHPDRSKLPGIPKKEREEIYDSPGELALSIALAKQRDREERWKKRLLYPLVEAGYHREPPKTDDERGWRIERLRQILHGKFYARRK